MSQGPSRMTEEALRANQALWDEWTQIHETSSFYDLAGFRQGGVRLRPDEIQEVGDVAGRELLHLQCHFGIDTLSWARLGARVTGADFSARAIALATQLAAELELDARFVRSGLYDLPDVLEGDFDIVYTSRGVLGWLPDISRWAQVVSHFLKPGGTFYITEIHPVVQAFENDGVAPGELRLQYPYWEHERPLAFQVAGSYADRSALVTTPTEYGWDHGLGEIVTALIDGGLRIESLREFPWLDWPLDFLVHDEEGRWRLPPEIAGELPLSFSLLAMKPTLAG